MLFRSLNAELIESRIELPIGDPGSIEVGRGVFRYHQFYDGNFWVHAGDGIHSHSSLVAYNPDTGVAVVILANLKSKFIENEYGLHFDILTGIESAFR